MCTSSQNKVKIHEVEAHLSMEKILQGKIEKDKKDLKKNVRDKRIARDWVHHFLVTAI